MKTTIELPDELLRQVRQVAAELGVPMRELMIEGLRIELERRRARSGRPDFVFGSVDGGGLVTGVEVADMVEASYER